LLFKGGTSLSKGFGLIPRFSEDIDITVFRADLGQEVDPAVLEALSGKQRRIRLDAIREAAQAYIGGPLMEQLRACAEQVLDPTAFRLELDPDDNDQQTLLLWYPPSSEPDSYIRSAVKIEAGAKSALDPHRPVTVKPYVDDLLDDDLSVPNVVTVEPERTFWDKMIIIHGLRQWHERRAVLRHGGQRVSRHYYDAYQLMQAPAAKAWLDNRALAADCARHARLFFGSPDLGLDTAAHGTFTLLPPPPMLDALRSDYRAMAGMVFGDVPPLDAVIARLAEVEKHVNG